MRGKPGTPHEAAPRETRGAIFRCVVVSTPKGMAPELRRGSCALVDPGLPCADGDTCVFRLPVGNVRATGRAQ